MVPEAWVIKKQYNVGGININEEIIKKEGNFYVVLQLHSR
jgi:hypothetical protein